MRICRLLYKHIYSRRKPIRAIRAIRVIRDSDKKRTNPASFPLIRPLITRPRHGFDTPTDIKITEYLRTSRLTRRNKIL